jgi:spore germination protein GerM
MTVSASAEPRCHGRRRRQELVTSVLGSRLGRSRAWTVLAAMSLTAVVASSCGIPTDSAPQRLNNRDVPFGLLEPATTVPGEPTGAGAATVEVFWINRATTRLAPETAVVKAPATLERALDTLQHGPTTEQAAAGLRTAIGSETQLQAGPITGNLATINLSNFVQGGLQEQTAAVAQLVYTATAFPSIAAVQLRLNGQPLQILLGDGSLTARPLTRADFPMQAPP